MIYDERKICRHKKNSTKIDAILCGLVWLVLSANDMLIGTKEVIVREAGC